MKNKPEHNPGGPLGRYRPPKGSIANDSQWRIDPERAARGYGLVLLTAPVAIAGLLFGGLHTGLRSSADSWLIAFLVGVGTLGATKRCFGFGYGTIWAPVFVALFAIAERWVATVRPWDGAFAVGMGVALGAFAAVSAPPPERRRAAGFAGYGSGLAFLLAAASQRFAISGESLALPIGALAAGVCFSAGTALTLSVARGRSRP